MHDSLCMSCLEAHGNSVCCRSVYGKYLQREGRLLVIVFTIILTVHSWPDEKPMQGNVVILKLHSLALSLFFPFTECTDYIIQEV